MAEHPDITDTSPTPLIGVLFDKGDPIDLLLEDVASSLTASGLAVAGLIQTRRELIGDCSCADMRLRDLATGQEMVISDYRGAESEGCHLDWQAITIAADRLERSLNGGIDVLIINRFGESESEGKGFRSTIEKAVGLGIQVVVAYRSDFAGNWEQFHGGLGDSFGLDAAAIVGRISNTSL
ncbi:MAG: DUF2478 domain-containing protein [Rhodobacteraceae bacterium]|nr:DUF2478 domain-containing protein [Paracoccaceae bacterium]